VHVSPVSVLYSAVRRVEPLARVCALIAAPAEARAGACDA